MPIAKAAGARGLRKRARARATIRIAVKPRLLGNRFGFHASAVFAGSSSYAFRGDLAGRALGITCRLRGWSTAIGLSRVRSGLSWPGKPRRAALADTYSLAADRAAAAGPINLA